MINLIKQKNKFDALYKKITELQNSFDIVSDNANYYQDLLYKTRRELITIYKLSGARTSPVDGETENESWDRLTRSIIDKLKEGA